MLLQCFQHQRRDPIPFPPRVLCAQLRGDNGHCAWIPGLFPGAGKGVKGPRCWWSPDWREDPAWGGSEGYRLQEAGAQGGLGFSAPLQSNLCMEGKI